jgi:enamine deaminase RidA (YjgF/YER057c/UK114 family)
MTDTFEKKHYHHSEWTKGRFSEVVTVTGPGRLIFLAGVGAEDEVTGETHFPGDVGAQARMSYDKLKKVLALHGASLADVVKQVTYVTDIRYFEEVSKCRREAYAGLPLPAHTFLTVTQLAFPGMAVEIDVTVAVPLDRKAAS